MPWKQLDVVTHWLMLLLAVVLVSACAADKKNRGGSDDVALGCSEDTGEWFIRCPTDLNLEPGQLLNLEVERVDVEEPWVWLVREDFAISVTTGALQDDPDALGVWAVLPALFDGDYEVAVGDADGPRSNSVGMRITVPAPLLSQADAAAVVANGMGAITAAPLDLYTDASPEWQSLRDGIHDTEQVAALSSLLEANSVAAAELEQMWLDLSPEEDRMLQAVFVNSGLMNWFADAESNPSWPLGPTPIAFTGVLEYPLHKTLMTFDIISAQIEAYGLVMTVVGAVALIFGPIGAAADAVLLAIDVLVSVIKIVIDTFIPTDLSKIQVQGTTLDESAWVAPYSQMHMFEEQPAAIQYWGTFTTESSIAEGGADVSTLTAFLISVIVRALPGPAEGAVRASRLDKLVAETIPSLFEAAGWNAVNVSFQGAYDNFKDKRAVDSIATPLDIRAYSGGRAVAWLQPYDGNALGGGGTVARTLQLLSTAFEVGTALEVLPSSTHPDADVNTGNPRKLTIDAFSSSILSSSMHATIDFKLTGWFYNNKHVIIGKMPTPEYVTTTFKVRVHGDADSTDPNDQLGHEAIVFPGLPSSPDNLTGTWVKSSETDRTYTVLFMNAGGWSQPDPLVTIYGRDGWNTQAYLPYAVPMLIQLELNPGENRLAGVQWVGNNEPQGPCTTGEVSGSGCLVVEFPGAMNADPKPSFIMQRYGEEMTHPRYITVWTPPLP